MSGVRTKPPIESAGRMSAYIVRAYARQDQIN